MNISDKKIIDSFIDHLWLTEHLSSNTQAAYRQDLNKLIARLKFQNGNLQQVDQYALAQAIFDNQEKKSSQSRALSAAKKLFTFLMDQGYRNDNPTLFLKFPRKKPHIPTIITENFVNNLLALPNIATALGLRDKALLEFIYATGMRVSEAVMLQLGEIDFQRALVITIGKGNKERLLPFGEIAHDWLKKYLNVARPALIKGVRCPFLFVSQKRTRLSRQSAWMIVKKYAIVAGMPDVSPHSLRHAFATHILNNGADLRVVQTLLGHSDIGTTQIYTHVANEQLKHLVDTHHPRNKGSHNS